MMCVMLYALVCSSNVGRFSVEANNQADPCLNQLLSCLKLLTSLEDTILFFLNINMNRMKAHS